MIWAADRLGPQSSYEKSYYEVWGNNQVGNHGEFAVHYLQAHETEEVENRNVWYDGKENIRLLKQVECWMGELIARAAQGGVQIIVETHSDHVLNGIRLCAKNGKVDPDLVRLYYFARQEKESSGEYRIVPVVENPVLQREGRLSFWPEGFFDEWDKAIDDLF